ncbi:monothiol glutaredoxin-S9-like [Salvia miltiorrhiza]|uniref:monothiol glutaredoxin-S9-like n=1 Tax=Salvia miltiorrhiza TaxID=226208 RepID=UPI0025AC1CE7|nr:monothiol glutaredoxin-S9-like [Salvia miltiorrhiza]
MSHTQNQTGKGNNNISETMQEAIHNIPTTLKAENSVRFLRKMAVGPTPSQRRDEVRRMVAESAVVVVGRRGCCMSHVAKRLLQGLGANPAVYEVDDRCEDDVVAELRASNAAAVQLPVVFVGGRWLGGLDRIMASHITGELTPLLKQAGALWL